MKKTFLSILFALAACLALLSTAALAAETGTELTSASFSSSHSLTGNNDANNPAAYHLGDDVTIDTTITVTGYVTLDLNGRALKMTGSGSVITVGDGSTAGHLTLTDSSTSAKHYFSSAWVWDSTASMQPTDGHTVLGGIITGGTGNDGVGVYVNKGSTFAMQGGNIVGCTAARGGGVCVNGNDGGTFTMSGGSIRGCTATDCGGGVYLMNSGAEFTMSGGTISNCSASNSNISESNASNSGNGGGVYSSGSFTMSGGTILNCTASDTDGSGNGGGVFVGSNGSFTMTGGSITGCSATGTDAKGGGVYGSGGSITITGPTEANKMLSIGGDMAATSCELRVSGNVTVEGKLTVSSQDANSLVQLSGGTFTGGIERTDSTADSNGCFALLPNNGISISYVYQQQTNGSWTTLKNSEAKSKTTLTGPVRVVPCPHAASGDTCPYCEQSLMVSVTKSGSTALYPSLLQALSAVKDTTGAEIKLL